MLLQQYSDEYSSLQYWSTILVSTGCREVQVTTTVLSTVQYSECSILPYSISQFSISYHMHIVMDAGSTVASTIVGTIHRRETMIDFAKSICIIGSTVSQRLSKLPPRMGYVADRFLPNGVLQERLVFFIVACVYHF